MLVTRILLGSYFAISRGVLADTVPKAVMHFLVNSVQRGLQQHLIQSLYHPNLVPSLLTEHPGDGGKEVGGEEQVQGLVRGGGGHRRHARGPRGSGVGVGGRR